LASTFAIGFGFMAKRMYDGMESSGDSLEGSAGDLELGKLSGRAGVPSMTAELDFKEGDIGVLPPLGFWDPLNLTSRGPEKFRRYQEMEIKHGRLAMAATLGVITTEAGVRLPGYLSTSSNLRFADVPGTLDGAYFGIPPAGWGQIVLFIAALEGIFRQLPENEPGDVVPPQIPWVRYDDPDTKTFKLNVERQNGRAAMLGILGMISHTALGQDALFPIIK